MVIEPSTTPGPLAGCEYLVIQFDRRDASLSVLDSYAYTAGSRDDALNDAQQAAMTAADHRLPLQYTVIGLATEATFTPSR